MRAIKPLAAALAGLIGVLMMQVGAVAATVAADYRFQDTRASSTGTAAPLTDVGPGANVFATESVDGTSTRVLQYGEINVGTGMALSPSPVPANDYTIVMLVRLNDISGFRKLIDLKAGNSDSGLYVLDGRLTFHGSAEGTDPIVSPNTYVQIALTRSAAGLVAGYVNGSQQFTFQDVSEATLGGNNIWRFLIDDTTTTTESASGAIARLRLFSGALTAAEVRALDRLPGQGQGTAPPTSAPSSPAPSTTNPTSSPGGSTVTPGPNPTSTLTPGPTPTSTGTPSGSHTRSVSLSLKRHLIATGRVLVADGFSGCVDAVPVKVQRFRGGVFKTVREVFTSSSGGFRVKLADKPGKYRVEAPQASVSGSVCGAASSRSVTHKHP